MSSKVVSDSDVFCCLLCCVAGISPKDESPMKRESSDIEPFSALAFKVRTHLVPILLLGS